MWPFDYNIKHSCGFIPLLVVLVNIVINIDDN